MAYEQPLPSALSPSRLNDFQACPRRYQHGAVERIAQPASYASTKGRFVHHILEQLFGLEASARTLDAARSFRDSAEEKVLTDDVRSGLSMDDELLDKLRRESDEIVETYFRMEDPRTVRSEGAELRLNVTIDATPLLGILDRLDRNDDGSLAIVDYKTGAVPDRRWDSQTFANTELYAALCESQLGERPESIRLLYVAKGSVLERRVNDVIVKARVDAAHDAWDRIKRCYDDGDFPATPSARACRFCSFKDRCRANGVPVPIR